MDDFIKTMNNIINGYKKNCSIYHLDLYLGAYLFNTLIAVISVFLNNDDTVFIHQALAICIPIVCFIIWKLNRDEEVRTKNNNTTEIQNRYYYVLQLLYEVLQDHYTDLELQKIAIMTELEVKSIPNSKDRFIFKVRASKSRTLSEDEIQRLLNGYLSERFPIGYWNKFYQCIIDDTRYDPEQHILYLAIWVGEINEKFTPSNKKLAVKPANHSDHRIPIALKSKFHEMGQMIWIKWDFIKIPHMLIFGSTGSGKTYLVKQILARAAHNIQDLELYVCDYKGDADFNFLDNCKRFYRYLECVNGLNEFYERFKNRQSGSDTTRHPLILLFDEWAAFCLSLEKKESENNKLKLGEILMLGRSLNIHIITALQRGDSSHFPVGARTNYGAKIGMGALSAESIDMLFHDYKDEIESQEIGNGYFLQDGMPLERITVPKVNDMSRLEEIIKIAVNS